MNGNGKTDSQTLEIVTDLPCCAFGYGMSFLKGLLSYPNCGKKNQVIGWKLALVWEKQASYAKVCSVAQTTTK